MLLNNTGGGQARVHDGCGSEESKQGSFKMLGREKKGDKSEASEGRELEETHYVLNIPFAKFCFK